MQTFARTALGLVFIVAGAAHFRFPQLYASIVPPYLPAHGTLVALSGAAEIAGGAGVLIPSTRRAAGIGLLALLVAVFPANLYMATNASAFRQFAPASALYVRLPLQALFVLWVWAVTLRRTS